MANFFSGLENFITNWDDSTSYNPEQDKDLPFVKGKQGAINLDGELTCYEASIFSKNSLLFENVIEAGVKSLVLYLIDSVNLITYTSCEGHILNLEKNLFKYRNVGILPRNTEEYEIIKKKLRYVEDIVNEIMVDSLVQVVIDETFVDSETLRVPCVDILFLPKLRQESEYFRHLEKTYQKFLELVRQEFCDWSVKTHA